MVALRQILENFNDMLKARGINIPLYSSLISLSEVDFDAKLEEMDRINNLSSILTRDRDIESNLTVVENIANNNVLIYWSTSDGKTFKTDELNMLLKNANKTDIDYTFIMSTYDKLPSWSNIQIANRLGNNLEFFNYTDFVTSISRSIFTPSKLGAMTWSDFLEDNPSMKNMDIPMIHFNDSMARYAGASPGMVIKFERENVLPLSITPYDLSFRLVTSEIDSGIGTKTGEHYTDF